MLMKAPFPTLCRTLLDSSRCAGIQEQGWGGKSTAISAPWLSQSSEGLTFAFLDSGNTKTTSPF